VNGASKYSYTCRAVKYTPRVIVKIILVTNCDKFFSISLWWAHVTVTPEDKRIIVFRRGTLNGLNGWMPAGGQNKPISRLGDRLL